MYEYAHTSECRKERCSESEFGCLGVRRVAALGVRPRIVYLFCGQVSSKRIVKRSIRQESAPGVTSSGNPLATFSVAHYLDNAHNLLLGTYATLPK